MVNNKINDKKNAIDDKSISVLSSNLHIKGDIMSRSGSVEILGVLDGNIISNNLTIHESGIVNGRIHVKSLIIKGKVNGNITGETVRLKSSANITGDIHYNILSIEDSAIFNGNGKKNQEQFSLEQEKTKNEDKSGKD